MLRWEHERRRLDSTAPDGNVPTPAPTTRTAILVGIELARNEIRTAGSVSELVVTERTRTSTDILPADRAIPAPLIGIHRGVAEVLIEVAVEVLLTALRYDADLAACRATILRVVIGGENLHLLNGVHVGNADGCSVGTSVYGNGSVKGDQVVLSSRPIDIQPAGSQVQS